MATGYTEHSGDVNDYAALSADELERKRAEIQQRLDKSRED